MSLARALTKLSPDGETERVVRDVLALFGRHVSEWLSESDVECETGHTKAEVHAVLPVLSEAYVLDYDAVSRRYRYQDDVALSLEVEAFLRRLSARQSHIQTNVARFRSRFGS